MTEAPEPKKQKMTPTLTTKLTSDKSAIAALEKAFKYVPKTLEKCKSAPNFNVMSWNVAGLRACLKKTPSKDIIAMLKEHNTNLLCLQETKCDESHITDFRAEMKTAGYELYAEKSEKAGYCGVFCFTNKKPLSVKYGLDPAIENDEYVHQKGRCLTLEFDDFYAIGLYVPNSGQGLKNIAYRIEKFDSDLQNYAQKLREKKPVVIYGDMNVGILDYDLANPHQNRRTPSFTIEERISFKKMVDQGYYDVFRAFNPDLKGAYTFWHYMGKARARNVGWRIDYFLCSEKLRDKICESKILSKVFGSDHCPITLELSL